MGKLLDTFEGGFSSGDIEREVRALRLAVRHAQTKAPSAPLEGLTEAVLETARRELVQG